MGPRYAILREAGRTRATVSAWGFALTAAYLPTIAGASTTPRWAVLALALIVLPFMPRGRITWVHIAGFAFVGYAVASLAWSPTLDSYDWLLKLLISSGIFIIGANLPTLQPFWTGAAVGVSLSGAMIAYDTAAFYYGLPIDRTHGLFVFPDYPAGLFVNGLFYAEAAALVAVALAVQGRWLFALSLVAPFAMLNTVPRGPIIGIFAAGVAWLLARGWRPGLIGCAGIMAISLTGATLLDTQTADMRVNMWRDVFSAFTPFGYGYGSYRATIPFHAVDYVTNLEVAPHNEAIGILYELGLPGLFLAAAFCAILLCAPQCGHLVAPQVDSEPPVSAGRLVLIAFLTEAMFGFGFHLPVTASIFALVAGSLSRDLPQWSDAFAGSRAFLRFGDGGSRRADILDRSDGFGSPVPLRLPISDRTGQATVRPRPQGAEPYADRGTVA